MTSELARGSLCVPIQDVVFSKYLHPTHCEPRNDECNEVIILKGHLCSCAHSSSTLAVAKWRLFHPPRIPHPLSSLDLSPAIDLPPVLPATNHPVSNEHC